MMKDAFLWFVDEILFPYMVFMLTLAAVIVFMVLPVVLLMSWIFS